MMRPISDNFGLAATKYMIRPITQMMMGNMGMVHLDSKFRFCLQR